VSIDATVAKRVDHAAGSELIHVLESNRGSWRLAERSLDAPAVSMRSGRNAQATVKLLHLPERGCMVDKFAPPKLGSWN
jgi:hypothetical protein